ncbi:43kDa postsynaptic protein [Parasponia andersonii]|uniref:43kDa postsynaptic protein n=1 Tax=Parasponia andersonii TaxID=3476 RepID=A0A2P5CXG3_PARAD|nr:43kDa postsynaptic protein [Parasponia andersonii]
MGTLVKFISLQMGLDQDGKEGAGVLGHVNWDDPIASQLKAILLSNLNLIFQSACKEISQFGYDEKDAEKGISRRGFYVGDRDPVKKIVHDTLTFLKGGKDVDTSVDDKFEGLEHLVEYTMVEMINVLREVRPFLSVGEAMWWLLICDLNVVQACRMQEESLSDFGCKENSLEDKYLESICSQLRTEAQNHLPEMTRFGNLLKLNKSKNPQGPEGMTADSETFVSVLDNMEKCLDSIGEHLQSISQTTASKEKPGVGQKERSKKEIAALLQKPSRVGRNYKAYRSKGGFRSGKHATSGAFVVGKRPKYLSEIPGVDLKVGPSGVNAELGVKAPLAFGEHHVSSNKPSTSQKTTRNPEKIHGKGTISSLSIEKNKFLDLFPSGEKSDSNSPDSTSRSPVILDYSSVTPYDQYSEKFIPQDEKDELITKLASRLQQVQNELEGWTGWANQKVMQAARMLTKDQLELKSLRQESDPELLPWVKIMRKLSDNITKRLSDMENALNNITAQLENAKSTLERLEVENSTLQKDVEVAKSKALESAASYQVSLEREHEALKEVESWEGQNGLLQAELETEKNNMAALQQVLGKAKNSHRQIEARWKQEKMEKDKLLAQAASLRKKREQILAKVEQESIKQKAQIDAFKKERLERIFSKAKSRSGTSRMAELKRGTSTSFGNSTTERKRGLRLERECVMCLSEEFSVVFLPCCHQVFCSKCNEIHEKGGMKDCPSCRTPILQRINVRFAEP